jgi:glycosyltransferase involved in cell wall biosynthesis
MRILHTESSAHFGGQELRSIQEIEWFSKRDHQVWLAAGAGTGIGKLARERGIALVPILFRGSFNPAIIVRLMHFCLSNRIDLIVTHSSRDMFNAGVVAKLLGIPLIRYRNICDRLKDSWIYRLAWRMPKQILTDSDSIRQRLLHQKLAPLSKIEVIGSFVDLAAFHPDVSPKGIREAYDIPEDAILITQIGCIRKDKGQKVLVLAMEQILQRHPNCWFMFVGSATQPKFMDDLMTVIQSIQRRDRLVLAGFQQDVAPFIAASDVICLTSLIEAQSLVIPQAFAMAKLVVASNVGGIPEILHHKVNGLLYEKGNPAALANAIGEILTLDEPALIKKAAVEKAQSLDINRHMERIERIYIKVIA